MRKLLLPSLLFEIIWWSAVWGQADWQWLTLVLVIIAWLSMAYTQLTSLFPVMLLAGAGVLLDIINGAIGLFVFPTEHPIPFWLVILWCGFAWYARLLIPAIQHHSPRWIIILGGLGGAVSYWAGYRFAAVDFQWTVLTVMGILFVQWAGLTWCLLKVFSHARNAQRV
ncbi:DUF2878 domain-containing protein [Vibrio metschnikovii]|nr:DUF2878 domain-containing protein [Vibrio metschnikovii]EKO3790867.1 DUF2878 domain-containing protein [Vibrio metschnikovii]EKO3793897.1 DUF2878 domain-containing protein [Vibrio metschnikovii]